MNFDRIDTKIERGGIMDKIEIVIVTGMSGAGKSTALNVLEDEGYYCVDNMPISLIPKFAELANAGEDGYSNILIPFIWLIVVLIIIQLLY